MLPQYSFIIPTFNGAHKIKKSLKSVFQNITGTGDEIILVVDGSTDNTEKVLDGFPSNSLKVIFQENQGRSIARNNGIKKSDSEYIFLLDDDMRIANNCLEVHRNHHESYPETILIGKVNLDMSELKKDFDFYLLQL